VQYLTLTYSGVFTLIHNLLNQGDTWKKYNITSNQVFDRNKEIADGSEKLWEYAQSIINKSIAQGTLSEKS
jgi:putative hydrolase of HD superfamily